MSKQALLCQRAWQPGALGRENDLRNQEKQPWASEPKILPEAALVRQRFTQLSGLKFQGAVQNSRIAKFSIVINKH